MEDSAIRKVKAGMIMILAVIIWSYSISRVIQDDWIGFGAAMFIAVMLGNIASDTWKRE